MEKHDKTINWPRVEEILMNHYTVSTSSEGADAYPPLLLFKCLMLQNQKSFVKKAMDQINSEILRQFEK